MEEIGVVLNEKSALIEMLRTDEPNQLTELLDQFKVPSYSENKLVDMDDYLIRKDLNETNLQNEVFEDNESNENFEEENQYGDEESNNEFKDDDSKDQEPIEKSEFDDFDGITENQSFENINGNRNKTPNEIIKEGYEETDEQDLMGLSDDKTNDRNEDLNDFSMRPSYSSRSKDSTDFENSANDSSRRSLKESNKITRQNDRSKPSSEKSRRVVTNVTNNKETSTRLDPLTQRNRKEVDKLAIKKVLKHEVAEGRYPQEMNHSNPGYDIESRDENNQIIRFIEVKGLGKSWNDFDVGVSSTQIEMCRTKGDKFWLYVVEDVKDDKKSIIHRFCNPVKEIDQYRFDPGWIQLSEKEEVEPLLGMQIFYDDESIGKIINIQESGKFKKLVVENPEGLIFNKIWPSKG